MNPKFRIGQKVCNIYYGYGIGTIVDNMNNKDNASIMYFVAYDSEEIKARSECNGHYWTFECDLVPVGAYTGVLYGS